MSASLRNARSQISAMQGRLEGLNLLNIDNVQAMVDRRVENITGVVNKLSSTCTTACPVQNTPQCKPAFTKISLVAFSILLLWMLQSFSPIIFTLSYLILSFESPPSPQLFTIYVFSFDRKPLSLCFLLCYSLLCSSFAISKDASPFLSPSHVFYFLHSEHDQEALSRFPFLLFFSIPLNSPQMLLW